MERGREGGGEGEKVWMVDFPKGWVVWEGGQEGGRAGPLLSYMRRLLTFPYRLHYRARSPAPLPALLAHGRAVVKDARPRELVRSLQALALLDRGRRAEGQDAFVKSCMVRSSIPTPSLSLISYSWHLWVLIGPRRTPCPRPGWLSSCRLW